MGEIKASILKDSEMRKIGFTDRLESKWFYHKIIWEHDDFEVSFSVTIEKENAENFRIDVLDEDFCQPYDYQYLLSKNPNHKLSLEIQRLVEKEINYLQNCGVLHGYRQGIYI